MVFMLYNTLAYIIFILKQETHQFASYLSHIKAWYIILMHKTTIGYYLLCADKNIISSITIVRALRHYTYKNEEKPSFNISTTNWHFISTPYSLLLLKFFFINPCCHYEHFKIWSLPTTQHTSLELRDHHTI